MAPRCLIVAGARPNFMKVAPVLAELDRRNQRAVLVHTGQHYDRAMSDIFFEELGMATPEHHLEIGSASHAVQTARIMEAFEPVVIAEAPDIVVVAGDVNSTVACALVAAKIGIEVAHIEAGLRSHDWAMPEEINRVVTDRLSQFLFASSEDAVDNLKHEGYPDKRVHLVGNVMIDTLLDNIDRARARPMVDALGLKPEGFGVLTLHRPSNVDDPEVFAGLLEAVNTIACQLPIVFPVHPRVSAHLERSILHPGVHLIEPLGYLDFLALQAAAAVVLTDSGGLQEETTVLGVPCLTLRDNTERPITIAHGTNQLAGTDPARIIHLTQEILAGNGPTPRRPPLWDGEAAVRIVDALTT